MVDGVARNTPDASITHDQARQLVDMYYAMQDFRIQARNMQRTAEGPARFIESLAATTEALENSIAYQLGAASKRSQAGRWLMGLYGIGPVMAAGLLAHLDVTKAPSPSAFWRFAGMDPSTKWGKGEKRPYNAKLKTLCWKVGQSFMKFSNREDCFYGRLYRERKQQEVEWNESGKHVGASAEYLATKRFNKGTETYNAYTEGRLPAAQVDARARRWVVKLFLCHLYEKMWAEAYPEKPCPREYVFEHMGHVHRIEAP